MIKAIVFDCFGVLTTDSWRAFVDSLPPGADTNRARELNRQYAAGFLTKDEFLQEIFDLTGRTPEQVEGLLDNEIVKNRSLLDYIAELKQDYKIGLLSNVASNWIRETFLKPEEQDLFDEMLFSYQVGMTKPDPRIFRLMCERMRVAPEEAVMVDDIATYADAATKAGMKGIVYESLSQLQLDLEALIGANDGVSSAA